MEQLYLALKRERLILRDPVKYGEKGEVILLEVDRKGVTSTVSIETFKELFSDVLDNPTYEALSGAHTFFLEGKQHTMTAKEMGYQEYFNQWKDKGIFSY
ncbi:hypothetical protein WKH56_07520 [Priestia sp. SB1]|uniref:hypothetical protein n=1 Tax=Priestia TaxID=2800373 RepID=UPI001DB56D8F|nr:hypothetical protein [Priestia megaterium]